MIQPQAVRPQLTNWWAIRREAINRIGLPEVERRIGVARQKARQIADDLTFFSDDEDREGVFVFMAWRLQSLAIRLSDFAKFESKDHDTLGCAVLRMVEEGVII